ncbi:MAG TPA: ABC transporter permease [Pyrinomonadaceae bacterium]|jgi:putative ABC transport system permease protein
MFPLRSFIKGVRNLFRLERIDRDIEEEIRFHLEMRALDNMAVGMTEEEAMRDARRRFGRVGRIKELCRELRGIGFMETLLQDLRYGTRVLRKNPGFTLVAVLTLALGIGANTAIFSIVNAVILRPLPFKEPDRIMYLQGSNPQRQLQQFPVSPPDFLDWKSQSRSFSEMAAFESTIFRHTAETGAERLNGYSVSANFFDLMGEKLLLGRAFTADEERPGSDMVVVLSETVWRRHFGADPKIIGQTVKMNDRTFTVIGVIRASFKFPDNNTEVWKPLAFTNEELQDRADYRLQVVGRLKDGVTEEGARAEMGTIARQLQQSYPQTNTGWGVFIQPLHESIVGFLRPAMFVLLGAVFFVLLIACVNVASLLSARMTARRKEVALRTAIGATRLRILRQLLTESVMLGLIGGTCGVLLAVLGLKVLVSFIPPFTPRVEEIGIDPTVLAFTLLISVITGLIFGLMPAWQTTNPNLNEILKDSSRGSTGGRGQHRFRSVLVVTEVVLSLVLLIGAGLLIRSFVAMRNVDPGFKAEGVLVNSQLVLPPQKYAEANRGVAFFKELFERVRALPGVESVGGITALPLQGNSRLQAYAVAGRAPQPQGQELTAVINTVGADYFQTMSIPLKRGRLFTERDDASGPKTVLVNETLARRIFPDKDPLGERLYLRGGNTPYEIVGVVGDAKQFNLTGDAEPEIFTHYLESPVTFMYVLARTKGDPASLAMPIRREVQAIDPDQPVGNRTLAQQFENSISQPRFYTLLLGLFAGVALILATIGIYGVMSYMVAQRTHEIGIRMALGAQRRDVLKIVIWQGLKLAIIGVVVGLGLSFLATRLLSSLLYGVSAVDPITFALIPLLLTGVAVAACFIPARRATRIDPLVALRNE